MTMIHPQFDPVALALGPIKLHWYGLAYLVSFLLFYQLATYRSKQRDGWTAEMVSDLLFYGMLGVIVGGRVGYVFFYQFHQFLANPLYLFKVWEGGMSFHGGFIGVMLAMWFFSRSNNKTPFQTFDLITPCVPIGLFFGRMGNYINGELWGRVSDAGHSWLMLFPQARHADAQLINNNPQLLELSTKVGEYNLLPRHPSQIYEAITEGLILFAFIWWFSSKPRPRMAVSAIFVMGYGLARFTIEFFRQPDADQGFILFGWVTKGQMLSFPMIVAGIIMLVIAYRRSIFDWGERNY